MLWALASSAFIMYLYHKLKGEEESQVPDAGGAMPAIEAEFAELDERIAHLESRLHGRPHQ
jgi:hypothetical protein